MTAVNIKGTFTKDERPGNGLEAIAEEIVHDEFRRWTVIGIIEQHKVTKAPGEAPRPTVRFVALEPLTVEDAAEQGAQMLDQARKSRGLGLVAETLFDAPSDDQAARTDGPWPGDADYQPKAQGSVSQPDEWLDPDGDKGR